MSSHLTNRTAFYYCIKGRTKVTVYYDIFLTESGLLPLPENAIELKLEFSIQSKEDFL